MNDHDKITAGLAGLAEEAPSTVLPRSLFGADLAHGALTTDTAAGEIVVVFSASGVTRVVVDDWTDEYDSDYQRRFGAPVRFDVPTPATIGRHLQRALEAGKPGRLPIDLRSVTPFQHQVLNTITSIPPGEVRPYAWVARRIGKAGAVRAVGTALARNPIPVILPCHRVVRSDGRIGQYAFGSEAKRSLLIGEGLDVAGYEADIETGNRFLGSATTGVFCLPTCRHARRITPRHRRWFGDVDQATESGFRPCSVCLPA